MIKAGKKNTAIFVAVFGLLIFLHYLGAVRPIESSIVRAANPIMGFFFRMSDSVRNSYDQQNDHRDLVRINGQLQDEIEVLTVENAKLKIVEEENDSLRRYLQFLAKKEYNYVLSNVISRGDMNGSSQSILIDKGFGDNIQSGYLAVDSFGAVVGKVSDVKESVAEILLTTNPRNKMAASIQNESKTSGVVQGELGLVIRMDFIPQTEDMKTGDTVITSGLEQNVPRGFAIGKVIKVEKENNEIWQNASIEPLVDLDKMVNVAVLLPSKND